MDIESDLITEAGLYFCLINITKNNIVADKIIIADKFWARMRGLMWEKELKEEEGLLLAPCNAVHMMFMRFPIDVIFLDKDSVVIKILHKLKPWRTSPIVRGAYQVIEMKAGKAVEKGINTGDKLSLARR
jgi:uncharacterized membrane protein (UPF0127 family)